MPDIDQEAMHQLVGGQDAALNGIFVRWHAYLLNFVATFPISRQDAEDVVQDTFVIVFTRAAQYNPVHPFKPWLFTIAANLAKTKMRQHRRWGWVALDTIFGRAEEATPPVATYTDEVSRLSAEEQVIVRLLLAGFTVAEIAKTQKMSQRTLERRIANLKTTLKQNNSSS